MSSLGRLLSKTDWLLVQEPEEPQRGYGEAVLWLLIGSFVASAGLFGTEGDVLQSLVFVLLGMMFFVLGAIYAVPTHRRRAVLRPRVVGTAFSLAAMLTGILDIPAGASNPLEPALPVLLTALFFIVLYRRRRSTRRS